jgi:hypothetical protein
MYASAAAGFPERGNMVRFSTVWGFPIPRSAIVSILFVLVVNTSSPFSPSGSPEGIRRLMPFAHNASNQASAYKGDATVWTVRP